MEQKETITFDDFMKLDIRIGTILSVEEVADSRKLLKFKVDFGPLGERQILAGIKPFFEDVQSLVSRQAMFVVNLEPKKMLDMESQGMIMIADDENGPVLYNFDRPIPPGNHVH